MLQKQLTRCATFARAIRFGSTSPRIRPGPGSVPNGNVSSEEWQLFGLINEYRAGSSSCFDVYSRSWRSWHGADAVWLALSPALSRAAHDYAYHMAVAGWFSHVGINNDGPADRIVAAGYSGFTWYGEVIAAGQHSAAEVMNGWRNSEGHNSALLACQARAMGAGYGVDAFGTRWVVDFGNHIDGNLAQ